MKSSTLVAVLVLATGLAQARSPRSPIRFSGRSMLTEVTTEIFTLHSMVMR